MRAQCGRCAVGAAIDPMRPRPAPCAARGASTASGLATTTAIPPARGLRGDRDRRITPEGRAALAQDRVSRAGRLNAVPRSSSHDRGRDYEALVAAYLESDESLAALAARRAESDTDAFGVMGDMLRALDESPLKQHSRVLLASDRIRLRDLPPDFAVLFAAVWCEFLHRKGERERFSSVLRFAQSLCRPGIDPRLSTEVSMLGVFAPSGRDRESLLRTVPAERLAAWAGHPRAWRVYADVGQLLVARGAREPLNRVRQSVEPGAGPRMQAMIAWVTLLDACIRGDVAAGRRAAQTTRKLMFRDAGLSNTLSRQFRLALHELDVVDAVLEGEAPPTQVAEERSWMPGMRDLLSGDLDRAVQRARALSSKRANAATEDLDVALGSYQRIRAEMGAGHQRAAARLLLLRHARGTRHFVDDLFLARLALADGEPEDAGRLMARAAAAAETQRAFGRIAFEMALARELNGAQVARLCRTRPAARIVARGRMRDQTRQFAEPEWPILIFGETGTGKELVARALHETGSRAKHPFVAINCAAVPSNLFEDELFGHARGAFTGALDERQGLFAMAGEGTLFLDEIGELAPDLQPKLLRVLENRRFRPIGATEPVDVHCRVVAATNRELSDQVAAGSFRQDLFYRLTALEISLPPLRERDNDRFELLRYFYAGGDGGTGGTLPPMDSEFERAMRSDDWPGNVRELRHFVERLKILSADASILTLRDFRRARSRSAMPVAQELPAVGPPGAAATEDSPASSGRQPRFRRLEQLREIFAVHRRLTRTEVAEMLGVASSTAGRDLKTLREDGVIRKVKPNESPRSHYFELVASDPPA